MRLVITITDPPVGAVAESERLLKALEAIDLNVVSAVMTDQGYAITIENANEDQIKELTDMIERLEGLEWSN